MAPSEVSGDILAVQKGDPDAFASLLGRYQNRLYRYLLRWVRDHATAEDLFQQTWMRVIANIHRFDARRNFDPWLFAVARNLVMDHLRLRRPDSLDETVAENRSLSESISSDRGSGYGSPKMISLMPALMSIFAHSTQG